MRRCVEQSLLYAAVVAALLPVIMLRDYTVANELRYLSIADEALRNHTLVAFTNHGLPYADKPPLYLWAIMLLRLITGSHPMWLVSLLSLVPALGITRIMDNWVAGKMDGDNRIAAQIMLLTSGLFLCAAVMVRMDMLMCFFIVLALRTFWNMTQSPALQPKDNLLFGLYMFLAVFTKGPLGLLVPLCGTTAFLIGRRRIREFFRYWNWRTWSVLIVCCAVWFAAVVAEGGAGYLDNLLLRQTVGRAVDSFHHAGPVYFYACSIWYSLAPWSLLVVGIIVAALRPKYVRGELQCFFLTIGVSTFTLLSCISSKLEIYLLPAIPFMVYAAAMFLPRFREDGWVRVALTVPLAIMSLALPALMVTARTADAPYLDDIWFYLAATTLTLCGISTLYMIYSRRQSPAVTEIIRRIGVGLLLAIFTGAWAFPKLNTYISYGPICREASALSRQSGITDIRTWHMPRPENMDVYLHQPVTDIDSDEVPATGRQPCLLLTRQRYLCHFPSKEIHQLGAYAIVVLEPDTNPEPSRNQETQ